MADVTKESNAVAMAQAANLHGLAQHMWCEQLYLDSIVRDWGLMAGENADVAGMAPSDKFVEGRTGVRDITKYESDALIARAQAIRDILEGKAVTIGEFSGFPDVIELAAIQTPNSRRFGQLNVGSD